MNEEKNGCPTGAEEISPQTGIENAPADASAQACACEVKTAKKPHTGAKKPKMSKQLIAVIVSVTLVLVILAGVLISGLVRDRRPPELESVRGRFEALIEASAAVNVLLFGDGLPTYPRVYEDLKTFEVTYGAEEKKHTRYYFSIADSTYGTVIAYQYFVQVVEGEGENKTYSYYDIITGVPVAPLKDGPYRFAQKTATAREDLTLLQEKGGYYYYALPDYEDPEFIYEEGDDPYYDYVRADSPYKGVSDIQDAAEAVYSAAYLERLYEGLFTGVAFAEGEEGVLYARYRDYVDPEDDNVYLQQCNLVKGYALVDRRYDYSTMQIVGGSNAKYVRVEIESYIAGKEQERIVVTLAFALEGGEWFLDNPSY